MKTRLFCILLCAVCLLAACGEAEEALSASSAAEKSSREESLLSEGSGETSDESREESTDSSGDVSHESSDTQEPDDGILTHRNPLDPHDDTEVKVHGSFPALSVFTGSEAVRRENRTNEAVLVTEITEEGFYGTLTYLYNATVFVFGSYEDIRVGDYVLIAATHYCKYDFFYAYLAEDVTDLLPIADNDLSIYFEGDAPEKPVIYLYPTEETTVSVKLDYKGHLTCTYPLYNDGAGWENLSVSPDGTIRKGGKEYYCLYWEGMGNADYDFSSGFCVKGEDTAAFLEAVLADIGLSPREANEFIIYWLPKLECNPYNVISFQGEAYTATAPLEVTPAPDSMLRVFMAYYPTEEYVEMIPQEFEGFERRGFTVVEWGGSEIAPVK